MASVPSVASVTPLADYIIAFNQVYERIARQAAVVAAARAMVVIAVLSAVIASSQQAGLTAASRLGIVITCAVALLVGMLWAWKVQRNVLERVCRRMLIPSKIVGDIRERCGEDLLRADMVRGEICPSSLLGEAVLSCHDHVRREVAFYVRNRGNPATDRTAAWLEAECMGHLCYAAGKT